MWGHLIIRAGNLLLSVWLINFLLIIKHNYKIFGNGGKR